MLVDMLLNGCDFRVLFSGESCYLARECLLSVKKELQAAPLWCLDRSHADMA